MVRRQFSREFKLEAVRLVKERGVSVVQASRDLAVGEGVLRRWIKGTHGGSWAGLFGSGPAQAGAAGDRPAAA